MNINYFKTGIFVTAAIALPTACNTTPATQPTTVSTTTPTATPTASQSISPTPSPTTSFLGQREKAIESSGKLYLMSLARSQQAFFLETNGKFSSTIDDLKAGIKAEGKYYLFQIVDTQPKSVSMTATAKQDNVKSFATSVFVVGSGATEETVSTVCGTDVPSKTPLTGITAPKTEKDKPTCPAGSSPVQVCRHTCEKF